MKKVKDYNDFIFDSLLEKIGSDGLLPFIFSKEFDKIISNINHPIANDLLNNENNNEPVTLIDVTEENDKVSLATSPKIIEFLMDQYNKPKEDVMGIDFYKYLKGEDKTIWTKYRSTMKIGKLIKKIFEDKYPDNGKPGRDIESFVNSYKAIFSKDDTMKLFDIVSGQDIVKWYDKDMYGQGGQGSAIHQSCMADGCESYLQFYAKNPDSVKMLILYEDDKRKKIVGRALVWILDIPKNRIFMDRIYTVHDYQEQFFKDYATKNGWLYKYSQTYGNEPIVDSKTDERQYIDLYVEDINLSNEYPYMDTLRYLDQDKKILSSERISDVKLIETNGGAYDCEWSDRYNRYINMYNLGEGKYVMCTLGSDLDKFDEINNIRLKSESQYLSAYSSWISQESFDEDVVKTSVGPERLFLKNDCTYIKYLEGWADNTYVRRHMTYSSYIDDHILRDDALFSKILNSYIIKDDSSKVYIDITKTESDYLPDKELDRMAYTSGGDYILKK